ncbi:hypothetical protein [uncultured Hymenobacter sp.]|uniref:hypothetical protein n=1 Tax=uncultured Hymenobacter sp. TaxID=170016 RepID=UPI0035C9658F
MAATEKLKQAGISPRALYDEAMRISGHSDEAIAAQRSAPTKPGGVQAQGVRYKPSGRILVQDTDLGNVALRGVEVKSRRWFQFGSNFTDTQGNFAISTSYKNKAKIALQFKNNLATTRGIISGLRFWQAVLPIKSDLGTYAGPAMQNLAYTVTFRGGLDQAQSKGASTWTAATLFNTLADAQTYSVARGLPGPVRGINIWLFPDIPLAGGGYASTPMLRRIADTSLASRLIDNMLLNMGPLGIAKYLLKQLLQRQLPDMTVFYRGDQGALASHQLNPLLYHELGHTQHYSQVGNSFWSAFIGKIITSFGYGDKTGIEAGRVAISEGWGNYVERLFTIDKYQASVAPARARAALFELDYQVPGDYGYNWFVYGMYHDMTDSTPEPVSTVVDDVTAYTPATVFRGLQSDVSTVRSYQARVNAQNSSVQAAQLERLVTSYRW